MLALFSRELHFWHSLFNSSTQVLTTLASVSKHRVWHWFGGWAHTRKNGEAVPFDAAPWLPLAAFSVFTSIARTPWYCIAASLIVGSAAFSYVSQALIKPESTAASLKGHLGGLGL
jgi:hypothetical protein